jgi:hypothetical protein
MGGGLLRVLAAPGAFSSEVVVLPPLTILRCTVPLVAGALVT